MRTMEDGALPHLNLYFLYELHFQDNSNFATVHVLWAQTGKHVDIFYNTVVIYVTVNGTCVLQHVFL